MAMNSTGMAIKAMVRKDARFMDDHGPYEFGKPWHSGIVGVIGWVWK